MTQDSYIYLDHAATTPVRPEVVEAMLPYWTDFYGNPSSVHDIGRIADQGLTQAREKFAELINSEPNEVIFTASGSESDNLAIRGVMWTARISNRGNHFITSAIEHKAVLKTAKLLRDLHGFELTIVPVDPYGIVDVNEIEKAIRPDTVLISIMAANNEIGSIQPLEEIGLLARDQNILFHSDAVQAAALNQWDFKRMPIDLLSFAAHKFYGPKGVGILFARNDIHLTPAVTGGGQEDGRRAGTENVPYATGAARAFELAMSEMQDNIYHYQNLRDRLINGILNRIPEKCQLTGHQYNRLVNHASFVFKEISGNDLLIHLDMAGIAASSGSACLVGDPKPSSVLHELGFDDTWSSGGLRLTVGRQNNIDEINYVLENLPEIIERLNLIKNKYL
ncbi:MAG: cysteine desulfurase NifS [Anaerolineae bacterium]|nr:MAG: cysteine desulfurase NifS [Anaerolineae bacterium]